jgi:Cu-Zn family superoxide dismutase
MCDTAKAHSGDMGNLEVGPDGHGHLEFTSDRWTLDGDDKTSVRGKAVVIHAKADDLKTQPTGDSGDRIGCGVVPR